MENALDFDNFIYFVGETIMFCQIVEHDIKWIYSIVLEGDIYKNNKKINKWTLGKTISSLEMLDNSDGRPYFGKKDYSLLKEISNERNYLCHEIYKTFVYENAWSEGEEYRIASDRLIKFHHRLKDLNKNIENIRLQLWNERQNMENN